MAPTKKVVSSPAAPTRRSTRITSQSSVATSIAPEPPASKKRVKKDEPAAEVTKSEKKAAEDPVTSPSLSKKAKTALGVGDKLPDLTLKDEDGNDIKVVDITHEKGIVLFAYPKANTPGCTKQACGFNDALDKISAKDYLIYGISTDPPKSNKSFKDKYKLQYHLLSDQKRELLDALGAKKGATSTLRSSWVVGKGGIIEDVQLGVSPADSITKALKHLAANA